MKSKPTFTDREVWLHNLRRFMNQYHIVIDLLNEGQDEFQANSNRHLILAQYSIVLLFSILEEWKFPFPDEKVKAFRKQMKPLIDAISQYKDISKIRSGMIAHPRLNQKMGGGALLLKENSDLDVPVDIHDMAFINYLLAGLNIFLDKMFGEDITQSNIVLKTLERTQVKPRFTNEEDVEAAAKKVFVNCGLDVSKIKFH